MKLYIILLLVIIMANAIKQETCNEASCKGSMKDCIQDEKCYTNLKQCLSTLQKEMKTNKNNSEEYNKGLDRFKTCMNQSIQSGKVLQCAKHTCPNSFLYYISSLFNHNQSKSFISLEGL